MSAADTDAPDACALRAAVLAGERSVTDVVEETLVRVDAADAALNAFLVHLHDRARARAAELDRRLAAGEAPGPLFGVPVAIKANMALRGVEANCGSRILAGWRAPYTATFLERLEDAGAVIVATTNMDEFAMGSSNENSAFGAVRNPWDTARTPGGSSGGSAAAVASRAVPLALGSDTGGSVRQPAALCGVFGLKPSYGRITRHGLIAFGSSLDQVGVFARSTRDVARTFDVLAGADALDSTCLDLPAPNTSTSTGTERLDGLRIGVPEEVLGEGVEEGVRERIREALAVLEGLGAEIVPVRLPTHAHAIPAYYVVATAEASSNLARYDGGTYGMREPSSGGLQAMYAATREAGFGAEVKRRVLLGTYVLSAGYHERWYGRALRVRTLLRRDYERAFEGCDVIAGPTAPGVAFALGARSADPLAMYLSDVMTVPASLAGLPALSVPAGLALAPDDAAARLPVGLQLVGPQLAEERLIAVAAAFEHATTHAGLRPPQEVAR